MSIAKIVITGGPCSGKTTGMSYLREKLGDLGYTVFVVPEIATELITYGFDPKTALPDEITRFEQRILRSQILHEDLVLEFANDAHTKGEKVVVLFDRGTMDIRAYTDKTQFQKIIKSLKSTTIAKLRDKRYDAVIHMITAANGAAEHYTLANNTARLESKLEDAILSCDKTRNAWIGHPHLRVVDNSTDFEGKIRRVYQEICQVLGIPIPIEKERKFLVNNFLFPKDLPLQTIDIEQVYLRSADDSVEERVRKRGQDNSFVYYRTRKIPTESAESRQEHEWQISSDEYATAVKHESGDDRQPIVKKRHCFMWNNIYFELDEILYPSKHKGVKLLEVEITNDNTNFDIPDFINIAKEVTGLPKYSNYNLALKRNQK